MDKKIYVYDPTIADEMSRVRGVGRYLKLLRSSFKNELVFTNKIDEIPKENWGSGGEQHSKKFKNIP